MEFGRSWTFETYRQFPQYYHQKQMSVFLWMIHSKPPLWAVGRCAVCAIRGCPGFERKAVDAHHLFIPRNYTRNIDRTVNWFWNLVPVHIECHEQAHGKEMKELLMRGQYERIGRYVVGQDNEMAIQFGCVWMLEQIDWVGLKTELRALPGM